MRNTGLGVQLQNSLWRSGHSDDFERQQLPQSPSTTDLEQTQMGLPPALESSLAHAQESQVETVGRGSVEFHALMDH